MAKSQGLTEEVPQHKITERSQILRDLSQRKRQMFYQSLLGTTQEVLFEGKKDGAWIGHTDNYIRVKYPSDKNLARRMANVQLNRLSNDAIVGREVG